MCCFFFLGCLRVVPRAFFFVLRRLSIGILCRLLTPSIVAALNAAFSLRDSGIPLFRYSVLSSISGQLNCPLLRPAVPLARLPRRASNLHSGHIFGAFFFNFLYFPRQKICIFQKILLSLHRIFKTQFPLLRTKTGLKSEVDKERTGGILDHAYYKRDSINVLSIVYTICLDI